MHGVTGGGNGDETSTSSAPCSRSATRGGVALSDGSFLMPDPHSRRGGRNAEKGRRALAKGPRGVARAGRTTSNAAPADPDDTLFFDAASTKLRPRASEKKAAIDAGKPTSKIARSRSRRGSKRPSTSPATRRRRGVKKRNRPRQARPSRAPEAEAAARFGLFRTHTSR